MLALPGCDDPPTCKLQVGISGATEGAANWSLSGEGQCGFISTASLGTTGSALFFAQGDSRFYLIIDTQVPDVGTYVGQAIFQTGTYFWQAPAGTCAVAITKFDFEDWSLRNFIQIEGAFQCEQPLESNDPEVDAVMLSTLTFEGHLYDELISP